MKKITLLFLMLLALFSARATNYGEYKLYADINFEDGTPKDKQGNAQTVFENNASVVLDDQRSENVFRFNASDLGNLRFNNSPLNDEMTFSFWFKREDIDPSANWRMMFSCYAPDGSNMYITPKTTWDDNAHVVYENKSYGMYKTVSGKPVVNNTWTHIAIVFNNNTIKFYQDGLSTGSLVILSKLSDLNTNAWCFGNFPGKPYGMTGRIDNIKIYHSALADNQIVALKNDLATLPEPFRGDMPYMWLAFSNKVFDKMDKVSPETKNVDIIKVNDRGNVGSIKINGYIKMTKDCLGNASFSTPFLLKKDAFTAADSGKYILKYKADNGDFYGLQLNNTANKTKIQLIKKINGIETVQAVSTRLLNPAAWNSIVFTQTITESMSLVRVYINGYSALTKTQTNLWDMGLSEWSIGSTDNDNLEFYTDAIKLYQRELSSSEILVYQNSEINLINITADASSKHQTIRNFGASDGWNAQPAGLYFPLDKKEKMAEMLFSKEFDENGNPKGIGLSSWRFNIGAGTYEQGEASRISTPERRTECFLNADGTYNWSKQAGQRFFLEKAVKGYNVPDIIGWQNSPPVHYTVRGLGFRDHNDPKKSILKSEHYDDFGKFLAEVITHFKAEGININYISPLNEPQHDWMSDAATGKISQEGSPWTNQEISDVVKAINNQFQAKGVDSKIFVTEAGSIGTLLGGTNVADDQLNYLWKNSSPMFIANLPSVSNIVSSHSYWNDQSAESIVSERKLLKERMTELDPNYEYWQTEYCLLDKGYRFGHPTDRAVTPGESAISLARIIHTDLAVANATAWQWWTTFDFEKYSPSDERFSLIRMVLNPSNTDGLYRPTKLLYALGNYSRFIRPGMKRIGVSRSDNTTDIQAITNQMVSAYIDENTNDVVMVVINASRQECGINLNVENLPEDLVVNEFVPYITTDNDNDNLTKYPLVRAAQQFVMPATSIVTFVGKATKNSGLTSIKVKTNSIKIAPNPAREYTTVSFSGDNAPLSITITDISGKLVERIPCHNATNEINVNTSKLVRGLYLLTVNFGSFKETQKLIVY